MEKAGLKDPHASAVVSGEVVANHVEHLANRSEPEEGWPVLHRVHRFERFRLTQLPLDWFAPSQLNEPVSPSLVGHYARERADTAPAIAVDGEDRTIIDGFHRFQAARQRGDAFILAYVGEKPVAAWQPWEKLSDEAQSVRPGAPKASLSRLPRP